MIHSWKLPALAMAAVLGYAGFFCPACGGGAAETPASASAASLDTVEFDVQGMTCAGCATATEIALKRLDGVRSAEASYDGETGTGEAVVEYDPTKVSPERMVEAVEAIGFHPTPRSSGGASR